MTLNAQQSTRWRVLLARFFLLLAATILRAKAALPTLKEDHVSVIGWTEAHDAVYGIPVQKTLIPSDQVEVFLKDASNEFLCRRNDFGQTALHLAVRQDLLSVVSIYINRTICIDTPNNDGDTALHYAAVWGRIEAVRSLLPVANSQIRNEKGETALDDARAHGHNAIMTLLQEDSDARQIEL